ncbi:MAG: DUF5717 family protein [Roseburia sp.]
MQKRIQQLASGKFEYDAPLLSFSTEQVSVEVLEGKDCMGDFIIKSTNGVPMHGRVFTSDARIECLTPQFEGEEARIRYQFHSNGLLEGDIHKGEFYIICNHGEYNLSFVASVFRLYADSSIGRIKSLSDFAALAHQDAAEAYKLFCSPNFKNILKEVDSRARLIYEGLGKEGCSRQKMEEFLIAIGKKTPVQLSAPRERIERYGLTETVKEVLELHRSHWGYVYITVASDADFLVPEKKQLTEEDFVGSVCMLAYYIDVNAMHGGKNYGRLLLSFAGGTLCVEVCAVALKERTPEEKKERFDLKESRIALMKLYIDYRLKKIVTGVWASKSIEILDGWMQKESSLSLSSLMKAQALIINKQRQEATWILEDFKREYQEREDALWGYYLYLCTLLEREPSYVTRMTAQIEMLFQKNQDSALLFWILLFTKGEYCRNNLRRYKAIEQWMLKESCSPFFYMEAYYLVWQEPYLLGSLDDFAIRVLNWARKQEAISRDIAIQVMNGVAQKHDFNRELYQILEACYAVYPQEEMLHAICGYLVKGQQFDVKYHAWYALGIEQGIRITGLYEAYLMSFDGRQVECVPKMIQMYFQYSTNISYHQRAILFVNIIAGKRKQPEVYHKYIKTMEQFTKEQIAQGHIDDNLAVVYGEMLQRGILDEKLARELADLLFTHRLTCENRHIARAVIWHREEANPQVVSFTNGVAYFHAYTDDYCIILEDSFGNSFVRTVAYVDEPLMQPERYLEECIKLAPDVLSYHLYRFAAKHKEEDFLLLLQSDQVSDCYKASLLPDVIRFYREKRSGDLHDNGLIDVFLSQASLRRITSKEQHDLAELLIETHRYEKAYWLAQSFGYDFMGSAARLRLCSYGIAELDFEEDDFLSDLVENTFFQDQYDESMVCYLCRFYVGATSRMARLWSVAGETGADRFGLEERILTQMLYTTEYIPNAAEIYESYCEKGGREPLCTAYLSYFSDCYVRKDGMIPENVFSRIKERYLDGEELNSACELALFKHLAWKEEKSEQESGMVDRLLEKYMAEGIFFAFYKNLDEKLLRKYQLEDKSFVECHAAPKQRITIHYRTETEEYRRESMTEMYDGIYVKSFVLFFGDTLQYYIEEEKKDGSEITKSGCIHLKETDGTVQGSYARLNQMLLAKNLQNKKDLEQQVRDYFEMQCVTEKLFRLL